MAYNSWQNQWNNVDLLGVIDITANTVKFIQYDEDGKQEIKNILDLFLQYPNIETLKYRDIQIGGGLFYTESYFDNVVDTQIPGLASLLEYLQEHYRRNDDDSIINNHYTINRRYRINENMEFPIFTKKKINNIKNYFTTEEHGDITKNIKKNLILNIADENIGYYKTKNDINNSIKNYVNNNKSSFAKKLY